MKPNPAHIQELEQILIRCSTWWTASAILQSFPRWTDRDIRACAAATPNIISGQRGYRHISHATPDEITHAADWIQSQGTIMLTRAQRIRARARELSDKSPVPSPSPL